MFAAQQKIGATRPPPPAGSGEAKREAAQTSDAKPEAASTAKASDELSEDDLEVVAGGARGAIRTGGGVF